MTLLTIKDLSVNFASIRGEISVLDEVSLTINKGEIVGLVGESGSGKSVTALAVLKLLEANASLPKGQIFYQDQELLGLTKKAMRALRGREMAMIFQEPMTALNPTMRVGKQIAKAIRQNKKVKRKAANQLALQALKDVHIREPELVFRQYPFELSGGMRQRIVIALAMSAPPKLLIADEPTTALDVTVQKEILNLMKDLAETRGTSILLITHDLGVVANTCERVYVMYQGQIMEEGPTKQVLYSPSHPYTRALIEARPEGKEKESPLKVVDSEQLFNLDVPSKSLSSSSKEEVIGSASDKGSGKSNEGGGPPTLVSLPEVAAFPPREAIDYQREPLLKITNLTKKFDEFMAVNSVNFAIYQGETYGLVGESGSGKSTIGNMMIGLLPPSAGEIIYQANDNHGHNQGHNKAHSLWGASGHKKSGTAGQIKNKAKNHLHLRYQGLNPGEMQIVFQDPQSSLDRRFRVRDLITEPLKALPRARQREKGETKALIQLMESVGLKREHLYRYPHEFSGGQRQRIAIARAMITDPKIIILDEPTSALDVSVQAQILNLLKRLQRERHLTYLFISHDMSVIRYMSDRIGVLLNGELVEEGEAEALFTNPKEPYTQQLFAALPTL